MSTNLKDIYTCVGGTSFLRNEHKVKLKVNINIKNTLTALFFLLYINYI